MKIRVIALAAALSALAGSALADGPTQATLQHPLASPVQVIAGDGVWDCSGNACVSGSATDQSLTISACKAIVQAAGPVSAYSVGGSSLNEAQLARCNGGAQAQAH